MLMHQSLLDFISLQMKCEYLSDLRYLNGVQRMKLMQVIEAIHVQEEDLAEWNDAVLYLIGTGAGASAQAAKEALLQGLYQSIERKA